MFFIKKLIGSLEQPLSVRSNSFKIPCTSNNLPVVSLLSSSSTSSSCTQLAETSSSHSNEFGDDSNGIDVSLTIPKNISNHQGKSYKKDFSVYIDPEMNKATYDDKQLYGKVSDTITEPLLAINLVGSKIYNGIDINTDKPSISNTGPRNVAAQGTKVSPTRYSGNGHKTSDMNLTPKKNSTLDYNNEALKLDQTRSAWSPSNVRKTSKNERRDSISSEESLSDYEELGGNHTAINGDIGSHKNSR